MQNRQTTWARVQLGNDAPPPIRARTTENDWKNYKDRILELRKDHTLSEIRAILQSETGFSASVAQYKKRLGDWENKRNLTKKQHRYILWQIQKRCGRIPLFREPGGEDIDRERILRLYKRQGESTGTWTATAPSPNGIVVVSPSPSASHQPNLLPATSQMDFELAQPDETLNQNAVVVRSPTPTVASPPHQASLKMPTEPNIYSMDMDLDLDIDYDIINDIACEDITLTGNTELVQRTPEVTSQVIEADDSTAMTLTDFLINDLGTLLLGLLNIDSAAEVTHSGNSNTVSILSHAASPVGSSLLFSERKLDEMVALLVTEIERREQHGKSNCIRVTIVNTDETAQHPTETLSICSQERCPSATRAPNPLARVASLNEKGDHVSTHTELCVDDNSSTFLETLHSSVTTEVGPGRDLERAVTQYHIAEKLAYCRNDYTRASESLSYASEVFMVNLGPNSTWYLRARRLQALILIDMHHYEESEVILKKTATSFEKVLGEYHEETRETYLRLAWLYAWQLRVDEIWDVIGKAIPRPVIPGPDDAFRAGDPVANSFYVSRPEEFLDGEMDWITFEALLAILETYVARRDMFRAGRLAQVLLTKATFYIDRGFKSLRTLAYFCLFLQNIGSTQHASALRKEIKRIGKVELGLTPLDRVMLRMENEIHWTEWWRFVDPDEEESFALEKLYSSDLVLWEKTFPQDYGGILDLVRQLQIIKLERGNIFGALTLFERDLLVTRRVWGESHPDFVRVVEGLIPVLSSRGPVFYAQPAIRFVESRKKLGWGSRHSGPPRNYEREDQRRGGGGGGGGAGGEPDDFLYEFNNSLYHFQI